MSSAYRESTVLAALLVVVAALIPILIADNGYKTVPEHGKAIPSPTGPSLSNFQWKSLLLTIWTIITVPLHAIVIPLQTILSALLVLLTPAILAFKFMLAIVLFPFKVLVGLARLLYPIYVFIGAACMVGLATGVAGKHSIRLIFSYWRPEPAHKPVEKTNSTRGRNRKRKDVGTQAHEKRRRIR